MPNHAGAGDAPASRGSPFDPPSAPAAAQVVHRTRERWRLRVLERRYDLAYFVSLYEALRKQPEILEVTVNPRTASVLVWVAEVDDEQLADALTRDGILRLPKPLEPPDSGAEPLQAAAGHALSSEATREDGLDALHPRDHHAFHMSVNDTRILVFLIMLALSLYQLSKKQFLAPALTMALYVIELFAGLKLERDAAVRVRQPDAEEPPEHPTAGA